MPGDDPKRLGDILGEVGTRTGLGRSALSSGRLWSRWEEIVGPEIAAHVEPTSLRDGVLRIRAGSPAWATEVGYLGASIARRAADIAGVEVTEVRVWTGPGDPKRKGAGPAPKPPISATAKRGDEDPILALKRAHEAWLERRRREGS